MKYLPGDLIIHRKFPVNEHSPAYYIIYSDDRNYMVAPLFAVNDSPITLSIYYIDSRFDLFCDCFRKEP